MDGGKTQTPRATARSSAKEGPCRLRKKVKKGKRVGIRVETEGGVHDRREMTFLKGRGGKSPGIKKGSEQVDGREGQSYFPKE